MKPVGWRGRGELKKLCGPEENQAFWEGRRKSPGRVDIGRCEVMKPVEGGLAKTKVGSNSGYKMDMFLYWIIILILRP
jgi:hypothetical protein